MASRLGSGGGMNAYASYLVRSVKANWLVVWVFLGLNAADCLLSQTLMARGMQELNPIWQVAPVWLKLGVSALFVPFLASRREVLLVLNVLLALIVAWNFALLWA